MHERRAAGRHEEAVVADLGAGRPVGVADGRVDRHREQRQPQPCRAPGGRGDGSTGPDQSLHRRLRLGRDNDVTAAPLERLAGEGLPQHLQILLGEGAALAPVDAGHRELLVPIAEAGDDAESPAAHEVEGGDLLGQSNRIVQRDQ